jgi:hypothetical protein
VIVGPPEIEAGNNPLSQSAPAEPAALSRAARPAFLVLQLAEVQD